VLDAEPTPAPTCAPDPVPAQLPSVSVDARQMAMTLAEELANLVSGVEGRAHRLIEAAPHRDQLPRTAEALLASLQRLRTLHSKLITFGRGRPAEQGVTPIPALIDRLSEELQHLQLGLELRWEPPPTLPEIGANPNEVHDALLFLCAALLRAEHGATHLAIACELCFASDEPRVQLEFALEWRAEACGSASDLLSDPNFTLDLDAADHLITRHGGNLEIRHLPGRSVRAVVRWPVAATPPVPMGPLLPATPGTPARRKAEHHYGGALVLESDPSVRAMLASELKAMERAVFTCADGASARSFLEATPDRFEILILDHPHRLDGGDELAATIRSVAPDLKIFVLAPGQQPVVAGWPGLHHIQKPFGVHELRRALASVLAAG